MFPSPHLLHLLLYSYKANGKMRFHDRQDGQSANHGEAVTGPLRSRHPGELALRDLPTDPSMFTAGLITARFLTLQVAELYVADVYVGEWLEHATAAVEPYISQGCERAPSDALRLRHVLDRIRQNEPERVVVALLAAGDTSTTQSAPLGAYGFYRSAYQLALGIDKKAGAVSASSRLAGLAETLHRPRLVTYWSKRCARLVSECH
jgi:hypothetical protein